MKVMSLLTGNQNIPRFAAKPFLTYWSGKKMEESDADPGRLTVQ
jgi:hypothetical protein